MNRSHYGGAYTRSTIDDYFDSFTRTPSTISSSRYGWDSRPDTGPDYFECETRTHRSVPTVIGTGFPYFPNSRYAGSDDDQYRKGILNANRVKHHVPMEQKRVRSVEPEMINPEVMNWYGIRGVYEEPNVDTAADRFIQQKHNSFEFGRYIG